MTSSPKFSSGAIFEIYFSGLTEFNFPLPFYFPKLPLLTVYLLLKPEVIAETLNLPPPKIDFLAFLREDSLSLESLYKY